MRILYGVTGHGLGHTMRARAIAHHLIAQGHDVLVAASGRAIEILRRHGLTVVAIDGMAMRYRKGEMRRAQTVVSLLRQAPSALAKNAGKVLTHRQILIDVWGPAYATQTHYLRVYTAQLRRKIEEDPARPQLLVTEPGVGYRFRDG